MYADTVSELLSAVIPGYDELPSNENGDEAAFVARYEAAIELANLVQTGLVIDATENDGWSPEQVTEDELNALFQSKVVPFVPCEGADGTVSAEWRVDVPLVVIDTDYAPFTEREAPFGDNVVFLSPGDEMEFLNAARAGSRGPFPWGEELEPGGEHRMNVFQGRFPTTMNAPTGTPRPRPSTRLPPTHLVSTTSRATCGSGARIGTTHAITRTVRT